MALEASAWLRLRRILGLGFGMVCPLLCGLTIRDFDQPLAGLLYWILNPKARIEGKSPLDPAVILQGLAKGDVATGFGHSLGLCLWVMSGLWTRS
jgi:hypothetical protein